MNKRKLIKKTITEEKSIEYAISKRILRNRSFVNCVANICDGKMNFEAVKMRHGINGRFRCGKKYSENLFHIHLEQL